MSPEDTVRAIHDQGGLAADPAPVRHLPALRADGCRHQRVKTQVDAIEGFNCRNIIAKHDQKARDLADSVGKPKTLGTDSHLLVRAGRCVAGAGCVRDARGVLASCEAARSSAIALSDGALGQHLREDPLAPGPRSRRTSRLPAPAAPLPPRPISPRWASK